MKGMYSIERLFGDPRNALPKEINYNVSIGPFESKGIWRRLYSFIEAIFKYDDINPITEIYTM